MKTSQSWHQTFDKIDYKTNKSSMTICKSEVDHYLMEKSQSSKNQILMDDHAFIHSWVIEKVFDRISLLTPI